MLIEFPGFYADIHPAIAISAIAAFLAAYAAQRIANANSRHYGNSR